jgi:hypothetical protein
LVGIATSNFFKKSIDVKSEGFFDVFCEENRQHKKALGSVVGLGMKDIPNARHPTSCA